MVIGEESFIDRDTRVDFQRSGTYHVLVVSGMNVSILAFVVFWTLRRLRTWRNSRHAADARFLRRLRIRHRSRRPSLARHLMCAIYSARDCSTAIVPWSTRSAPPRWHLLILDPRQLFTASFQMTFVCVLIVAAIGNPHLQRTSQLHKRALAQLGLQHLRRTCCRRAVAQFRVDLQFIAARLAAFRGKEVVGRSGALDATFSFSRVGIDLRLRRHADGPGLAHGLLLSSRHDHRIARQPDRRPADAIDDARRSRCA